MLEKVLYFENINCIFTFPTSQILNKYDVLQEKTWTDIFPLRSKQEAVALDEGDKGKGIRSKISAENPDTEYGEDSNELIKGNEPPVMYEMKLDEVNIFFNMGGGSEKYSNGDRRTNKKKCPFISNEKQT